MKSIIALVVLALAASVAFAEESTDKMFKVNTQIETSSVLQTLKVIPVNRNCIALLNDDALGQRGCCSHHGGVCGCSGGSVVCCDNTYSPSCTCRADGIIQN